MYQDLSPEDFKEKYEHTAHAVLLDVRTPAEIAETAIEGHIAINIMQADAKERLNALSKDNAYFIYCRSGNRSGQVCRYLDSLGYTELYNLDGGILAWNDIY